MQYKVAFLVDKLPPPEQLSNIQYITFCKKFHLFSSNPHTTLTMILSHAPLHISEKNTTFAPNRKVTLK